MVFLGAVEGSSQMSSSLRASMMRKMSVFFASFPQPIMPRFFASGQISSLAFSSAQGLPNNLVGLPSLLIATELKLALEWSGAGDGALLLSEEEEVPRLSGFFLVAAVAVVVVVVAAGGRKVPVDAGGTKVALDAGGEVTVDAGGGRREAPVDAGGGRVAVIEFVATASMMLSVG